METLDKESHENGQ